MLPKRERLSRKEFTELLACGRRIRGSTVSLLYRPAPRRKCGVVVSKKTARQAPARRLLRRRVYHILRDVCPPSFELVVFTTPQAASLPYTALHQEIKELLQHTGVRA